MVERTMGSRRYRLQVATITVVREGCQPVVRVLDTPERAAAVAVDLAKLADDDREHFWVMLLNAQNRLLRVEEVSVGTQSASLVHPREVFRLAVGEGASSLILVHNHPSGVPEPSPEDRRLTLDLVAAGQVLDIRVHDHIVVGNGSWSWVSLASQGAL